MFNMYALSLERHVCLNPSSALAKARSPSQEIALQAV
jgi:hypothetical protein